MIVTVQYTTQVRTALGRADEQLEIDDDAVVSDLLKQLASANQDVFSQLVLNGSGQLLPNMLLTVNDEQVANPDTHKLAAGDTVLLLSTISGG